MNNGDQLALNVLKETKHLCDLSFLLEEALGNSPDKLNKIIDNLSETIFTYLQIQDSDTSINVLSEYLFGDLTTAEQTLSELRGESLA